MFFKIIMNGYELIDMITLNKNVNINNAIKIAKSKAIKYLEGIDAYRIAKCSLMTSNDDYIYLTPMLELNKGMMYNNQLHKENI